MHISLFFERSYTNDRHEALTRAYEFSGNQLIVKSVNPNEHWKVAWERY
jgi:hypothetical protein